MNPFFEKIPYEEAEHIDRITKLSFELRENRLLVLERHAATNEAQLQQALLDGTVPEHPGYESYLSASILATIREAIRAELNAYMKDL